MPSSIPSHRSPRWPPWCDRVTQAWAAPGPHEIRNQRTREQYTIVLTAFVRDTQVTEPAQVGRWVASWLASRTELAPSSRKAYTAALRAVARVLDVPLPTLPRITVPPRLPRPVADTPLRRMLTWIATRNAAVPSDPVPALLMLCRHGLRNSEACALTAGQVVRELEDRSTLAVQIQSKRGALREVPLNADGVVIVARYLDTLSLVTPTDRCFPDWDRGRLAEAFRALRVTLALPPSVRGVHALRHTFASNLHDADVDLLTIQDLMGHADIRSTQLYTQVSGNKKRRAVLALPSIGSVTE